MSQEKIILDLQGLGLSDDEKAELEDRINSILLSFLLEKSKPVAGNVTALGPRWIGKRKK